MFLKLMLLLSQFHGREAYVLENNLIHVSALRGGGHIAEIRFLDGLNPMRVPHYQTIEPYNYDPAKHDALYGSDSHRWLSSGYMGHLLCFPAFGPPSSPEEIRNGLGNHGEAPIVEWKPLEPSSATELRYGADLTRTRYKVERKLRLRPNEPVLYVEEWVENLEPYDRVVNWVEHATFGPPFIEPGNVFLDCSGTRGEVAAGATSFEAGRQFDWPQTAGLRPFQTKPHAGGYFAVLMDRKRDVSYFTLFNPKQHLLVGYLWRTADSPWLGDFQENERNQSKPWDGETVTRGIEFGTTPMPEGLRKSVDRGSMFGVPTYRWIPGGAKVRTAFAIFLLQIPPSFGGVAGVSVEGARIVVREAGTGREIDIPAGDAGRLLH